MIIIHLLGFFLAGFIQEMLVVFYQRAVATQRVMTASIVTMFMAVLSLLVFTEVTKKIFDPEMRHYSIFFVVIYAIGRGCGAYLCLKKLVKW